MTALKIFVKCPKYNKEDRQIMWCPICKYFINTDEKIINCAYSEMLRYRRNHQMFTKKEKYREMYRKL